ncbi:hypothetical protein H5410_031099 [Solanum commersonii]|uniref:Uncharacterized protein n=1 Tax=Solanum commersonii TaxID=4109 RepID=A0A9J5YHI8_SOLCO|nr:hypothetical protein H5410_031099 [Solanum commersonii]
MIVMIRAMNVRKMVIMGAMIIAMIKNLIRIRATIPEENMREMVNIALLMVPMMIPEHVTPPTPRMKAR